MARISVVTVPETVVDKAASGFSAPGIHSQADLNLGRWQ
jgi:hypothetical protein